MKKIAYFFPMKWNIRALLILLFCACDSGCYVAYEFTAGQKFDSDYVNDICRGKGKSGYKYSHYEYSTRDKGTYTAYDYKCFYCKD